MNFSKHLLPVFLLIILTLSSCNKQISQSIAPTLSTDIKNVEIHRADGYVGPCEPTICIDPTNTERVLAGSVLDNLYLSEDGGKTWTKERLTSPYGVYGDPVIRIDPKGNIYYSHLSNPTGKAYVDDEFLDRIVVQRSTDHGKTWNDGAYPKIRGSKDQDKQWMDTGNGKIVMTWTEFDKYGDKSPECKSRILFSMSSDEGENWIDPIAISQLEGNCIDSDQTTEGAVPVIDEEGNIYVAWSYDEKIFFDFSTDGGKTWQEEDLIAGEHPGGWDIDVPGIGRCNGMPILEMDKSNGPNAGTLYINWSDQRNGPSDTDIWLMKSKDKGMSWSEPVRVNDDGAGKHQFFSWMDVDPVTGYIYIVFYDRRGHRDNGTDVYLAYSTDGGDTFSNKKINEHPFMPNENIFFGDYNDISAYNGMIRPIWTRLDNYVLSVWTALIEHR